jgi:hypothetical protein
MVASCGILRKFLLRKFVCVCVCFFFISKYNLLKEKHIASRRKKIEKHES